MRGSPKPGTWPGRRGPEPSPALARVRELRGGRHDGPGRDLRDGAQIWRFLCRLLPHPARIPVAPAGHYSWHTLGSYVRATVLVAFADAVGIGIGLAMLRVPLALPLAALAFLGAFIPVINATLSGTVAALVALVTQGPVTALIVLGVVIGVQQLEGHVLQPLVMGRAVACTRSPSSSRSPPASIVAGVVGTLVAVPLLAVTNTAVRYLAAPPQGEPTPTGNYPAPDPPTTSRPKPSRPPARAKPVSSRITRRRCRPPSIPIRGRRPAVPQPAHDSPRHDRIRQHGYASPAWLSGA
ncbi:AI-2E family transporter [Polymorphospora sp. A560]|uniref:AI-2E family transporter n=1 Tax=Polymorphospora sp. A560 TaxID=3040203 RepID=UPI003891B917